MNAKTIKEKYIEDYPIPITLEGTEKILTQMKTCVCKILMDNGNKGTGFFCKIPFPNEDHLVSFLVTNNHIIDESYLKKDKRIDLTINNDKIKKKLIIGTRRVYTSKSCDTTIIEIFEDKDDIKNFLELDFNINEDDFNNTYISKSIYALQYPNSDKVSVSYGIIKTIDLNNNYDILHLCSTDKGSSGAPLLNIKTNKLIGIHKGASNNYNYNKGTLLVHPFKEFISIIKKSIQNKQNRPKKMVLKHPIENIIFDNNWEGSIKHILESRINWSKRYDCEGYQIFGLIGDKLYGVLEGPPDTYYENGFFQFVMIITKDFQTKPPKFYFKNRIFHPNVDEFGLVSCDILRNEYSPVISTFDKIILSVQSLLDDPNPDDFVNEYAAKLYKENRYEYEKTVRYYVSEYANFNVTQNELKKLNFKMELNN